MSQGPYKQDGETVYATEPIEDRPPEEDDSDEPKYYDRDWLYYQYHILKKSTVEIADECDVYDCTISQWMKKFEIDVRPRRLHHSMGQRKSAPWRKREWLYEQYITRGKSTVQIAEEYDTSSTTITNWLDHHDIDKRSKRSPKFYEDRKHTQEEWLKREYHDRGKTLQEIADEVGVPNSTILHHMDRHGIERRSVSEAKLKRYAEENGIPLPSEDTSQEGTDQEDIETDLSTGSYSGPSSGFDMAWSDIADRNVAGNWVPHRDEEWLKEQYCEQERTTTEIADMCGVSGYTICNWLEKFGIERRSLDETATAHIPEDPDETYRNRQWLQEHYCEQGMTGPEMAELCGVTDPTIYDWLDKYDIDRRPAADEVQYDK